MLTSNMILFVFIIKSVLTFNLSPFPNVIEKVPKHRTFKLQTRSSFFGLSLTLRKKHLMVGSPRSQTTFEQQRKIEETGNIYKCDFSDEKFNLKCEVYRISLDKNFDDYSRNTTHESHIKDYRKLGFSMDGHESDSEKFVSCAPKLKAVVGILDEYLLHGICYAVMSTSTSIPVKVHDIAPLRSKELQTWNDTDYVNHYYYYSGECGFSVHVTDNNEEIIAGCPGILSWRGSVTRQRTCRTKDANNETKVCVSKSTQDPKFITDVPNPYNLNLLNDSYLGYAVGSGRFLAPKSNKLFYVASAPRVNYTGEVYIFDMTYEGAEKNKIKIKAKLRGSQYGEYFGYALLCEDFNGDKMMDIAVSAPLYTQDRFNDSGAVYVFINKGNFEFEQQTILYSSFHGSGRFGSSLSKIGDINLDGFNDLIVSAPFENNGTVYVFLGGKNGISKEPSQKLEAPTRLQFPTSESSTVNKSHPNPYYESSSSSMFGFGLSRGADVDGNKYPDIAIGAPNAEEVYIYRSYPVIKVKGRFILPKNKLTVESKNYSIKFCINYESPTLNRTDLEIKVTLILDKVHNRASSDKDKFKNSITRTMTISRNEKCVDQLIFIRLNADNIFNPLVVEMKYEPTSDTLNNFSNFCDTCFLIDSVASKSVTQEISFSTGCKDKVCKPNISVSGTLEKIDQLIILGSQKTIKVKYLISNTAEPAYGLKLTIEVDNKLVKFYKIPKICSQNHANDSQMICDIGSGKPFKKGQTLDLDVILDISKFTGNLLRILAEVTSTGDDIDMKNNRFVNEIILDEFSKIEINGKSNINEVFLDDNFEFQKLHYQYEIYNNGPSDVRDLLIMLKIPVLYETFSKKLVKILEFDNITIEVSNGFEKYEVEWNKNQTVLHESRSKKKKVYAKTDFSKLALDNEMNIGKSFREEHHMRKRNIIEGKTSTTRSETVLKLINSIGHSPNLYKTGPELENLPLDQGFMLNCTSKNVCIEAKCIIRNFHQGNIPVTISLKLVIDLKKFDQILNRQTNILIYNTNIKLQRAGDDDHKTLEVSIKNPYTIIYGKVVLDLPMDIIVLSAFIGLCIFIILCYSLSKCEFFRRAKKEELKKVKRESMMMTAEDLIEWQRMRKLE